MLQEIEALTKIAATFGASVGFAWLVKKFLLDFVSVQAAQVARLTEDQREDQQTLRAERNAAVQDLARLRPQLAAALGALAIARGKLRRANRALERAGLGEISDVVIDLVALPPGGSDDE